jgi:hypothetical protein
MIQLSDKHTIEAKPARETGFLHITLGPHAYLVPSSAAYLLADGIADALTELRTVSE